MRPVKAPPSKRRRIQVSGPEVHPGRLPRTRTPPTSRAKAPLGKRRRTRASARPLRNRLKFPLPAAREVRTNPSPACGGGSGWGLSLAAHRRGGLRHQPKLLQSPGGIEVLPQGLELSLVVDDGDIQRWSAEGLVRGRDGLARRCAHRPFVSSCEVVFDHNRVFFCDHLVHVEVRVWERLTHLNKVSLDRVASLYRAGHWRYELRVLSHRLYPFVELA